jgi:uncharacterized protein (TIGR03000 family)
MYSLVLMTAFSGAPDAPQFNGYFRDLFSRGDCNGCNGCNGCTGGARYSCNGGGSAYLTGCTGCTGCCGGHGFLGVRDWWDSRSMRAGGCCGGSSAQAMSYGCCGGTSYSCFGGTTMAYNPQFNAGLSCQGGFAPIAPAPDFGSPFQQPGGIPYAQPDVAPPSVIPDRIGFQNNTPNNVTTVSASTPGESARGTVIVRLPADAKLFADGSALKLTGAERKFVTPPLPIGRDYSYQFKVEYERNGETLSVTKRVLVRGGGNVNVEFTDLTATKPNAETKAPTVPATNPTPPAITGTTVSNTLTEKNADPPAATPTTSVPEQRAVLLVKVPAGAKLTIDGRECPGNGPVRQFTTPALPAGKEFAYLMKAEVTKNGQSDFSLIQKVHFRAGDQVSVDFTK